MWKEAIMAQLDVTSWRFRGSIQKSARFLGQEERVFDSHSNQAPPEHKFPRDTGREDILSQQQPTYCIHTQLVAMR
jgi:hypothetical protein